MIDCHQLSSIAQRVPLVRECDAIDGRLLRICTEFLYPNGSNIDLFIEAKQGLFEDQLFTLSDLGQTGMYLQESKVNPFSTARRRQLVADICSELQVTFNRGPIHIDMHADQIAEIPANMLRLVQACIRVSDFASHHRLRSTNPFNDDVEDFFDAAGLKYTADVEVATTEGRLVRLDFEVKAPKRSSYVQVLAASTQDYAHTSANEIFTRWFDLAKVETGHQHVTIYNSTAQVCRPADLARIGNFSIPVGYPAEQAYLAALLNGDAAPRPAVTM